MHLFDESWRTQFKSLLSLRFTLARRNLGVSLTMLLVGAGAIVMLSFFQYLANALLSNSTAHMPVAPLGTVPRCVAGTNVLRPAEDGGGITGEPGCWTLLYFPDTPGVRALIDSAVGPASASGLVRGVDYAPLPGALPFPSPSNYTGRWVNASLFTDQGDSATCDSAQGVCADPSEWASGWCVPCVIAADNRTASELTVNFPGSTQTIVWFITQPLGLNDYSYAVSYNLSATQSPFNKPARAAEVKRALDEAILGASAKAEGSPPPSLHLDLKDFPIPPPRISGFDVFSQSGAQWTFLPAGLLFFNLLTGIVVEKEEKLRIGMRQMGLRTSAYWAAWAIFSVVFSVVSCAVLLVAGHAAGLPFFSNAAFGAPLLLYLATSLSYAAFAVLLSSLVTTAKSAQQLGYSIALVSFLFIAIVGSGSGVLLTLLYSRQLKPWMKLIRQFLFVVSPALAYTYVLYDIEQLAGSELDLRAQRIVVGPGFNMNDFTAARTLTFFGYTCDVPSPGFHLGVIIFDLLVYLVVGLWLDSILPGPQGSPSHPLFCLGFRYKTRDFAAHASPENEDVGVVAERQAAADAFFNVTPLAVRIENLRVVYRTGWAALLHALTGFELSGDTGELGSGDVVAVKELSLTVARGEIVALLGHNGAGKSTTIHVLTGLVSAAGGKAQVAGFDVIEGARGPNALAMGVCPQHDLLFPLLTARETMFLFCGLKNLPKADWDAEVESTLASVNLADVADRLTSTFSGGMKRRLSVALAALGRPPLLIFDEPSTGLDPLARAELLQLLQGLKKTSGLLLTTHSMSEASALGDRIAIMAGGLLVAVGSTVELTTRYGRGYSLSLTLVDDSAATYAAVEASVRERSPAAQLALRDGVAVTFNIPFSAVDAELPGLLEWADSTRGEPVMEYGVSGPTLEDAFIAVSAASHFNLAEQALGGGQGDFDGAADAADDSYEALADDAAPVAKSAARLVHALVVKNLTLISRARGLCICQLVTPLLILGLLLTLEVLLKVEVGLTSVTIVPPIYLPLNIPLSLLNPDSSFALRAAIGTIARGASSDAGSPLAGATRALAAHVGSLQASNDYASTQSGTPIGTCMSFYLISVDAALGVNQAALEIAVGAFPRDIRHLPAPSTPPSQEGDVRGFLKHVPSYWCRLRNSTVSPTPFFDARGFSNGNAIDAELFSDLLTLNRADSTLLQIMPPCAPPYEVNCPAYILPDGAWLVHDLSFGASSESAGVLSATLQINTAASTSYHRPNGISRPPPPAPSVLTLDAARLGSLDLVTRAFASWSTDAARPLAMPLLSIASTMSELSIQTISDVVEIIGAVLFVILLSAPLPLFIFVQVQEKELRLDEMQLSMGVRAVPAQAVIFAINAVVYGVIVVLFWAIAGGYMQLRVMAHTSPLLLGATFLGHGLALVGTGSLVSAFVWDRQVATVLGVILGIVSPLIATSIMAGVYGRTLPWSLNTVPPAGLYAIPILGVQFALSRILYLATFSALAFHEPLTSSELDPATSEIGVAIFSLYFSAAAYAILAMYLEQVLPRRFGTPRHFLFCVHRSWRARAAALIAKSCGRHGADFAHVLCGPASALNAVDDEPTRVGLSLQSESSVNTPPDAPFVHTARWAPNAGLSHIAATSAYALGEDSDVFASRQVVDAEIWPRAIANPGRCGTLYPILIKNLRKEWPLATSVTRRDADNQATSDDAAPLLGVVEDEEIRGTSTAFRLGGEGGLVDALPYAELEQRAMLSRGVKVAVSDLSLAIPAGACFGLLGENGAGKTSTVAMLQGLYVPTGGSAFVGGFDITTEQQNVRLSLGIVPQFDVLWPTLTIAEHVLFYARVKGVPYSSEASAVQDILRRVGLADVSARRSDALSGGMRRRLSIACAMVGAPRVVLLDELTTGLDPASRRAVWRIITRARQSQPRAVFVVISHDMAEVEALCSGRASSCAIMTHGRVRALGSVTRLRERYGGGVVLRVAFRADAADSANISDAALGAILDDSESTQAWVSARALVERLFPTGDGSARVDGHVFQTRGRGAAGNVVEAGSANFVLSAGSTASGAQVSIATAFRRLRAGVTGGSVVSWAIEAQTLEAVFSRVVRHYRA